MRIRVKDVLDLLASSAPRGEILRDCPELEPGDLMTALDYTAGMSGHPVLRLA